MQSADQRQRVEGIGCFDAGSFLKSSSTFQNFFTFALLPSSSAFLQTPKYQPSALFPAVSSPLTSSSYLEPTPCFCPRCYLSQFSSHQLQLPGTNSLFLSTVLPQSVLLSPAPATWNQLPVSVHGATSVSSLKSALKTSFFSETFSSVPLL